MPIGNSLLVALIVMSITFSCLIVLSILLKVQSFIFGFINNSRNGQQSKEEAISNINSDENNIEASTGELKLVGVDEKTAAMIIAIVSDKLEIPLDELQFKSIKLINS